MPRQVRTVTEQPSRSLRRQPLPGGFTKGALLVEWLTTTEVWQQVEHRVRVARRAGSYVGLDLVLFLLLFFTWPARLSLKKFGAKTSPHRIALGGLGGRKLLPTPPSVSRGLKAVDEAAVRAVGQWLLVQASHSRQVLQHPCVADYDTQGDPWHVFDWDGTRKGIRRRALVEGPQYPPARRGGQQLGAPGYLGRKRGELVLGRAVLQHSGSGLWIYMHQAAGHSETTAALSDGVGALVETMQYADLPVDRAVLRADGGSGNIPSPVSYTHLRAHET